MAEFPDSMTDLQQMRIEDKPQSFRNKLLSPNLLIDVHTHFFNVNDVPNNFLSQRLKLSKGEMLAFNEAVQKDVFLKMFISKDYRRLLDNIAMSPKALIEKLNDVYRGHEVIYTPLLMDMRSMGGDQEQAYAEQIRVIDQLCDLFPDTLLPFLAIDPNSDDFVENFIKVFDIPNRKYHGVKIYPSLGYLPSHPNLMKVFKICEDKQIPITTHCSSALVRLPFKTWRVKGMDRTGKTIDRKVKLKSKYEYKMYFNAPNRWIPVLKKYPRLKVNIAHFGGDEAWSQYALGANGTKVGRWIHHINALIKNFENVYADFSYTLYSRSATSSLVQSIANGMTDENKILFGTDFFLIEKEDELKKILLQFKSDVGDRLFRKMSQTNNINFLFH